MIAVFVTQQVLKTKGLRETQEEKKKKRKKR